MTTTTSTPRDAVALSPATLPDPTRDLQLARDPDQIVRDAERAMTTLARVIDRLPPLVINGERYLRQSDLELVVTFFSLTTRITETRPIRDAQGKTVGFEAVAELVDRWTGRPVNRAEGECTSAEPRWASKPRHQWRSMAQTRASRRALSLALGWVVRLGGFTDRPIEDVEDDADRKEDRPWRQNQK